MLVIVLNSVHGWFHLIFIIVYILGIINLLQKLIKKEEVIEYKWWSQDWTQGCFWSQNSVWYSQYPGFSRKCSVFIGQGFQRETGPKLWGLQSISTSHFSHDYFKTTPALRSVGGQSSTKYLILQTGKWRIATAFVPNHTEKGQEPRLSVWLFLFLFPTTSSL